MNIDVIEQFLERTNSLKNVLDEYKNMREMLIENGNVESDLSKGLNMNWNLVAQKNKVQNILGNLIIKLVNYGLLNQEDVKSFQKIYLIPKLSKIDEETPLNNGNQKSNNRRK